MGAPLYDITIYYDGDVIKDAPSDWKFRRIVNYISDFYHNRLNGHKPPKTGRICVHLGPKQFKDKPSFFGAICSYDNVIDEKKYLKLSKKEKYNYILNLLHSTVLQIADFYKWDKSPFIESFNYIIENDFQFEKYYPSKISRDKKTTAQAVVTKTEEKSILSIIITNERGSLKHVLVEKKNTFWYDSIYDMGKNCKWVDKNSFGIKVGNHFTYFSLGDSKTHKNISFEEFDI